MQSAKLTSLASQNPKSEIENGRSIGGSTVSVDITIFLITG